MGKTPYEKIKISNGVEICFWENDKGDGRIFLSPTIVKNWKGNDGVWEKRTITLNMSDLYRLFVVGSMVKEIEERFKEEKLKEK